MNKDSWLQSESFIKRALAIYGYNLVGSIIVGLPFALLAILIAVMFGVTAMQNIQMAP